MESAWSQTLTFVNIPVKLWLGLKPPPGESCSCASTHVHYCRTDTDRYLQLTVRTFRTDRRSCLRSEYRACISLSHQGRLRFTVRTFRTDRHPCLQTVIYDSRSVCRGINGQYKYDWASLFREDGNMSITRSISVAQTGDRVLKAVSQETSKAIDIH